jgi:hypothetical protein
VSGLENLVFQMGLKKAGIFPGKRNLPDLTQACEKIGDIPNFPTCPAESDGSTSG